MFLGKHTFYYHVLSSHKEIKLPYPDQENRTSHLNANDAQVYFYKIHDVGVYSTRQIINYYLPSRKVFLLKHEVEICSVAI